MAYTIYRSDGVAVTVPDNAIDSQFYNATANPGSPTTGVGIQLNGRNAIDYGAPTAQTWLQMTENFASNGYKFQTGPTTDVSLVGQLWFDKSTLSLYVKVSTLVGIAGWRKIPVTNPIAPADGDVQVLAGPTISIFAGGVWNQIFPAIYS